MKDKFIASPLKTTQENDNFNNPRQSKYCFSYISIET
jgi:hypothetical protein